MESKYCFEGDERIVDMLAKSIAVSLKRHKYEEKIHVIHPGSPHVYQYSSKDKVISLTTSQEKGKYYLFLESEEEIHDFKLIVEEAIVDLFKNVIVKLIRSIEPASERKNVLENIKEIIKKIE